MKTNFRKDEKEALPEQTDIQNQKKDLSPEEFEKFIIESGAKGSFMVYRSTKKDDELGIDN